MPELKAFESAYYKHSKVLCELIGLWPYQSQLRRHASHIFCYLSNLSLTIPQVLFLYQVWGEDFDIMLENVVATIFAVGSMIKYSIASINYRKMNFLILQMENNWLKAKDTHEQDLIVSYAEDGKSMSMFYTVTVLSIYAGIVSIPFIPLVLDHIYPLQNGTYEKIVQIHSDYRFFNQTDYHYTTTCHLNFVYLWNVCVVVGLDSMYMIAAKHVCSFFSIISYRLKNIDTANKVYQNVDETIHHHVSRTVILHNDTALCLASLEKWFSMNILVIQLQTVTALSILYYFMSIYMSNDLFRAVRSISLSFGLNLHLLFLYWFGQEIIDTSKEIFNSTYFNDWYMLPPRERRLMLTILLRSSKEGKITCGKISPLTLETYGNVNME